MLVLKSSENKCVLGLFLKEGGMAEECLDLVKVVSLVGGCSRGGEISVISTSPLG